MNESMLNKLKEFKLSGMINAYDIRIEEAIKNNLSYEEFMENLLSDERINRQNNGNKKRFHKARFPQHKTLEEFNFNYQPTLNKQQIYGFGTCEFIRKKENIALIGPPGTGKTHIAIAIGVKAVMQGYNVHFCTVNEMLEELYMSRADNSYYQKLKKYISPDLLILDELGLKKLNQSSVDDFYEIISKRYENKSIILTSNKTFDEWGQILYDPVLASAILDRLVHHCNFIMIDGESYRMSERRELSNNKGRPVKAVLPKEDEDNI